MAMESSESTSDSRVGAGGGAGSEHAAVRAVKTMTRRRVSTVQGVIIMVKKFETGTGGGALTLMM